MGNRLSLEQTRPNRVRILAGMLRPCVAEADSLLKREASAWSPPSAGAGPRTGSPARVRESKGIRGGWSEAAAGREEADTIRLRAIRHSTGDSFNHNSRSLRKPAIRSSVLNDSL